MGEFLFYLTIKPVWFLFEIIFRKAYEISENPGISILAVSIFMNVLVLPMYLRSDRMQAEERNKQKSMEYWVKHIRKTFAGDERFMILSEYYRQNDYQPWYVLKSSLSLLLQVPFFVAAYDFLSGLSLLSGRSFWFIRDLGVSDGLISVGGFSVNILPILMTTINLISAAIYTKGGTKKEKIQTVGIALIFLVLLYRSPAGLVFYWTLNNIFSLCKNIVMDMVARHGKDVSHSDGFNASSDSCNASVTVIGDRPNDTRIWALSSVVLAIFTGLTIPLSVIDASPMDFVETLSYSDPVRYALLSFAIAAGTFLLWGSVVYFLGNDKFKRIWSRVILCCSFLFIANHMLFSGNFGTISYTLEYDTYPGYDVYEMIINVLFIVVGIQLLIVLAKKKSKIVTNVLSILVVCEAIISIYSYTSIEKTIKASYKGEGDEIDFGSNDINDKMLKFSASGKNVVVMMLDRSIGAQFPFMMEEHPELKESFAGFTFYPNTASTGDATMNASAALFGGYEYAAEESNKRDSVLYKDKQNQALKLMPELFSDAGYHSTLINLPYANFDGFWNGQVIFDDVKNCDTYHVQNGEYSEYMTDAEKKCLSIEQQKRNFFFYSLFRSAPLFLQRKIYDNSDYLSITTSTIKAHFIHCMIFLRLMPELTQVSDESTGELIMIENDAPHENTLLNPPNYETDPTIRLYKSDDRTLPDGRVMSMSERNMESHYDANMAAFLKLGVWLDHLKELGVYDNTRIIITSDHGFDVHQFGYLDFNEVPVDAERFNPVLLVKDYDAGVQVVTEDDAFMTNADVPTIAMSGIIDNPVNPNTGNPVNSDRKYEGPIIICGGKPTFDRESTTIMDEDGLPWYSVHDNIFDPSNWEKIR